MCSSPPFASPPQASLNPYNSHLPQGMVSVLR
jgi:hypothetical protein